ncbi:MAG: hypothetical protein CMO12_04645 [Thaumarchaeota archaeon]|nr:hypothetical protein [Nitrososphaerota archaeon]|tara:strand:- start:9862 stop:10590 length:729 start_codon:yes stop_codon:yes gene_type:complete
MITTGGKTTYGEALGIITLDTRFPRIPGDVGNASTYPFPVRYVKVSGATVRRVIKERGRGLLPAFIRAARQLESDGVRAITTTAGFLALYQKEMADAVTVPFFSSSLIQVPLVHQMLGPDTKIGIITADSSSLNKTHLSAVGIGREIPLAIAGLQNGPEFSQWLLNNGEKLDVDKVESEVLRICKRLVKTEPSIGALVFECTNLPPFAAAIQEATHLPVFDIVTLAYMVHDTVVRRRYLGFM